MILPKVFVRLCLVYLDLLVLVIVRFEKCFIIIFFISHFSLFYLVILLFLLSFTLSFTNLSHLSRVVSAVDCRQVADKIRSDKILSDKTQLSYKTCSRPSLQFSSCSVHPPELCDASLRLCKTVYRLNCCSARGASVLVFCALFNYYCHHMSVINTISLTVKLY